MAGDAAGGGAHHRVMMRQMAGDGPGHSTADAALRLCRRGDRKAGWKSEDQGKANCTHEGLPELIDAGATWVRAAGSD